MTKREKEIIYFALSRLLDDNEREWKELSGKRNEKEWNEIDKLRDKFK